MRQVPAYFKQFLLIETPRTAHMLEASNFMMEICLPSALGTLLSNNINFDLDFKQVFKNSKSYFPIFSDGFHHNIGDDLCMGRMVLSKNGRRGAIMLLLWKIVSSR